MLAPLVLLALLPGADKDDAEKLFRQMEAKMVKAKTIDCTFDVKVEAEKTGTMKGTLLLGEGNKVRMEMAGEFGGMKGKITMISDGTKMKAIGEGAPARPAEDTPKWMSEAMRALLARAGVALPFMMHSPRPPEKEKEFKVDDHFTVSDFKLGKKEMVDKQEAQVVQYTLMLKMPKEEKVDASVWIDTKTQLPLKRVFTATMDGKKFTITETYTKMDVDGKIDPKQFELPKE
jgi:outer membrane lipoprotein-sorting protein